MNYIQIENCIETNLPFTHDDTLTGRIEAGECNCSDRPMHYVILSYTTEIYRECLSCGTLTFNERKYSRTTSRQQAIIRRAKQDVLERLTYGNNHY